MVVPVLAILIGTTFAVMFFWLGEWYGRTTPDIRIPPRPTRCPWCQGPVRSVLVWSSVCRVCDRGQVGPFAADSRTGWKEAKAAPFVSRVDVGGGDRRP
jgi:hypothetical protein